MLQAFTYTIVIVLSCYLHYSTMNSHHEGFSSFMTEGTVAVVDCEVHEVVDPHSEDMK